MKITKSKLSRIIREEARRLREDHIDTELDHLKKNVSDDLDHIKDLNNSCTSHRRTGSDLFYGEN